MDLAVTWLVIFTKPAASDEFSKFSAHSACAAHAVCATITAPNGNVNAHDPHFLSFLVHCIIILQAEMKEANCNLRNYLDLAPHELRSCAQHISILVRNCARAKHREAIAICTRYALLAPGRQYGISSNASRSVQSGRAVRRSAAAELEAPAGSALSGQHAPTPGVLPAA
jgi:hypothetical protein